MTKGEETRQFIIERSAPIFNTKGIAATSMSDVMEATKLSKGCLYVHFDNKDVLASAVVDYNMETLGKKVQAAILKPKTAKGKLLAYVDVLSDTFNPPVQGGCPILNFGTEADDTNNDVRKKVNTTIESALKTIGGLLKDGIKAGEFKSTLNHREFATMLFAMIEGGVMMSRVAGNPTTMTVINKYLKKLIEEQSS